MVYLQKFDVPIGTIRFHGVVDLQGLWQTMRNWLTQHQYIFFEKAFKVKAYPEGLKKELEWTASKEIDEYYKYTINIFMVAFNIMDVEVVHGGEKKKLTSCRLLIEINGVVELDPNERFKKTKLLQSLQDWYHKHVIKRDILFIHADGFYYHALKLHREIKEYLEFETKTSSK